MTRTKDSCSKSWFFPTQMGRGRGRGGNAARGRGGNKRWDKEQASSASSDADSSNDDDSSTDDDSSDDSDTHGNMRAQNANVGEMPPGSSDEESDDERQTNKPNQQAAAKAPDKKAAAAAAADDADPEQMAKDMERLALIKQKRAAQAQARIDKEGWDRFKPMSEDNRPPGTRWPPPDDA